MAYLALYREWRPKNFKEIVGQDHVSTTLMNALMQNKVAHAYLFSGPRGTGKTTAAKVLAKALNCAERKDAEPCNHCSSCHDIDQGLALDVLEIDAASNRGIDEIRDLREKVKLAASGGKYKVYIIDEVHMLTTEAFNALLKTLEEPPVNVVFVLATTEAHKIPLTILSRVQRFEFHRISSAGISARLQEVCTALGRDVQEKALQVIAAKAEGGLRDALSILDQCLLQDDPIKLEHVYQVIGMLGETYSADLTDSLLEGDYAQALVKLDEGVVLGRDPRQIIRELLDYLRQALLFVAGGQEPLLAPEMTQRLVAQARQAGMSKLLLWINVLLKGEGELRYATNARLAAEMILVQTLYHTASETPEASPKYDAVKKRPDVPVMAKETSSVTAVPKETVRQAVSQETPGQEGDLFAVVKDKWPEILEEVKKKKRSTQAFLLEGRPVGVKGEILYLVFKEGYSFHKDKFNTPENKIVVEGILEQVLGRKLTLQSLMENEYENIDQKNAGEDQCIQKAVEFFGTELVQVSKD